MWRSVAMTREEMLDKLHKIRLGAQATVATMDMGLQYEYVTSEGYGESFGGMGEWPAYRLEGTSLSKFEIIKAKIRDKTLTLFDLENTDFKLFYNHVFCVDRPEEYIPAISDFFEGLQSVLLSQEGTIYALCDSLQWKPTAYFFGTYNELETEFLIQYVYDIEEWENLEDEDLKNWIERLEHELNSIPFITFHEEETE